MKKHLIFANAAMLCGVSMMMTSCSMEVDNPVSPMPQMTVATFEDVDVTLNEEGYWNGGQIGEGAEGDWGETTWKCQAHSGNVTVNVDYSYMEYAPGVGYDWWMGIALSNRTGTELTSMDDQYNNVVGSGAEGSRNFAVIYGDLATIDINVEGGAEVSSLAICNSAYTMQNVLVGDGYSPKFDKNGDHIYVNIEATKNDGTTATKTVKLAEYTTELYYITGWEVVDLKEFGQDVTKLTFTFDAHNSGVPQYVCIDNIVVTDYK